jgi:hypothetical protein
MGNMIDPQNMMGKLAQLGLLGVTQDPDSQGHWRTDLGSGQTLVYGPNPSPPDWFWVIYDGAAALSSGDEPSADAMAEHVRREMEARGRLYHG